MNYKNIDEERHFQSTLQLIHENRTSLALQISQLKERINQLGRLPDKDTKESRNLLMVSQNQLEQLNRSLNWLICKAREVLFSWISWRCASLMGGTEDKGCPEGNGCPGCITAEK